MRDLGEAVHCRSGISLRLRAWPKDAEMEQQLLSPCGSCASVERQVAERFRQLVAMLAMDEEYAQICAERRADAPTAGDPQYRFAARSLKWYTLSCTALSPHEGIS
jgi:hypothetical protein